jgi:filamentous hemagglutinin
VVKQMTTDADGNTNLAANAMAHAALGALLAAAKGRTPPQAQWVAASPRLPQTW